MFVLVKCVTIVRVRLTDTGTVPLYCIIEASLKMNCIEVQQGQTKYVFCAIFATLFRESLVIGEAMLAANLMAPLKPFRGGCVSAQLDHGFPRQSFFEDGP